MYLYSPRGCMALENKWIDMQTVQTQIRLLLKEQSDQGLHWLSFH